LTVWGVDDGLVYIPSAVFYPTFVFLLTQKEVGGYVAHGYYGKRWVLIEFLVEVDSAVIDCVVFPGGSFEPVVGRSAFDNVIDTKGFSATLNTLESTGKLCSSITHERYTHEGFPCSQRFSQQ
jgi:hypothetical protein